MGASTFEAYADVSDADSAFRSARAEAAFEYGHCGHTGSLAEKDSYVILTDRVMKLEDARRLAHDLIHAGDRRIDDKWGPAGAIPVRRDTRTLFVHGLSGTMMRDGTLDKAALGHIARLAREQGLISDGETVTSGRLVLYNAPYPPHRRASRTVDYTDASVELTVRRSSDASADQNTPDGWLFVGWASC